MDAPGTDALRRSVQAEIDRRGWQLALSPADASVMLTLGTLPASLAGAADLLRSQMPQPRVRRAIEGDDLTRQLDAAVGALTTPSAYEANATDAATQLSTRPDTAAASEHDMGGHDMGGHDMSGHDMSGHSGHDMGGQDMSGHDMSGHSGHDMGGQDMSGHDMSGHMHHGGDVAGLPMAGTAPDRDGLQLDQLAVTLGPVLPGWPTGLILTASMQGDVLTEASLSWADDIATHGASVHNESNPVVVALDALARFLLVAGWPLAAEQARRAEWAVLSGDAAERDRGQAAAAKVARRVLRSRFLAWSVRGIGDDVGSTGDVLARARALATVAAGESSAVARITPEQLESVLEGAELAAARLIVASFVIQPAVVAAPSGHRHG